MMLFAEDICNLFDSNNNLLYMDNSPHFSSGYPDPLKKEWELFFKNLILNNEYVVDLFFCNKLVFTNTFSPNNRSQDLSSS